MNTPDKQQRLQELLLELALPETKITDSNLEQYIFRLQDIYEADFRHLYSGVFGVITRHEINSHMKEYLFHGTNRVGGWPLFGQPTFHTTVRTVRYAAVPRFSLTCK